MTATDPHIDLTRLEKVKRTGNKITARCPACAESGNDRAGEHLVILPSGKFGCTVGRDKEHRSEIFRLVGIRGDRMPDPRRDREWREQRDKERHLAESRQHLIETAREKRSAIIARHRWNPADVWDDSPQRIDQPLVELDPRFFLNALFPRDANLWTGEVFHSGTRHAGHWRTVAEWQAAPLAEIGPMVTPSTWKPGTCSRTAGNIATASFTVLDFDGFDNKPPVTPAEIKQHVLDSLALVRWLREGIHWQLAALIWSGNKSLHAWFHTPPPAVLQSLRMSAAALGMDAGLIGHPEHPCRCPGQRHAKTGKFSKLIWLQSPDIRPTP